MSPELQGTMWSSHGERDYERALHPTPRKMLENRENWSRVAERMKFFCAPEAPIPEARLGSGELVSPFPPSSQLSWVSVFGHQKSPDH